MPMPSEHSCRLESPDKYDRFARKNCEQKHEGKCIDVIYGIKEGKSEIQALRYNKEVWTEAQAKSHCKDHDGSFEAAQKFNAREYLNNALEDILTQVDEEGNKIKKHDGQIERKSISVELKADEPGSFIARIATLNVRDKDNDITLPGAFPEGKTVLVSAYQHGSWMGRLPVGKAIIHEVGNEALAYGQFNLAMSEGKDTYEAVKFAPELQEWSYGFYPEESEEGAGENAGARILKKVDVKEISPVLVGAGVDTLTLAIKQDKPYAEQAESVLAAVTDLTARTKSLADLRLKEGRTLSVANRDRMKGLLSSLTEVAADLKGLLDATEPKDDKALLQAILLYTKIKNELSEVIC